MIMYFFFFGYHQINHIATLQKMFKYIHVQVAPQLVLQEVQGLIDMAPVCYDHVLVLIYILLISFLFIYL